MLTQMRALSENWIGRSILVVVLGFIIFSFAIWGIGDRFSHFNASELARVGTEKITVDEFRQLFEDELSQLQQKQRRAVTTEEARRTGLDRQVLSRLVNDATLEQEAHRMGLAVSDASIARIIMKDEHFKGPTGQFDRMRFNAIINDMRMTEQRFVSEQRDLILRRDLGEAITAGLAVPTALQAEIHRFQTEVRDAVFFSVPQSAAGTIGAPSAADLKTFYDQHASEYRAPEYRKLNVLSIVPADLTKSKAVSDADIKQRYEADKSKYAVAEKRTVEQLIFPNAKAAEAAKAKLAGGTSFDKLAAAEKKSPADISLGTVTRNQLSNPAVAAAAFDLPDGGTSTPVTTPFGAVLVHVRKIEPAHDQTLAEVSGRIRDEIARGRIDEMRTKIENERTAGKTLKEAAATVGLTPRTIEAIDAQGRDKTHKPVEGLVEGPAVLKAAFSTPDAGADTEVIPSAGGGDVWFELVNIEPSHQLPLETVKPQVEAAWRTEQVEKRLVAESDKLVKALNSGKPIETVAADAGKPQLMKATNITRRGGVNLSPDVVRAMFAIPVGKAGSAPGFGGDRVIFKITAARVPPFDKTNPQLAGLMSQVQTGYENDIIGQYITQLQSEIGVGVNQRALDTALGGNDAGS